MEGVGGVGLICRGTLRTGAAAADFSSSDGAEDCGKQSVFRMNPVRRACERILQVSARAVV